MKEGGEMVPLQFDASDFFKARLEKATVRKAAENQGINRVCG